MCGEHSPCSGHTGFAPYRGVCAFPIYTAQAPGCSIWSRPCVECGSSFWVLQKSADSVAPAFCAFRSLSCPGSQRFGALSPGAARLFPPRPQCVPPVGSQEVFRQERGLFAGWEGVASLGLSLPLSPPPDSFLQRGWAGSSLEFLSPFVLRTASSVFRPVNFLPCFPTVYKSSLRLLSGPSGRSLP